MMLDTPQKRERWTRLMTPERHLIPASDCELLGMTRMGCDGHWRTEIGDTVVDVTRGRVEVLWDRTDQDMPWCDMPSIDTPKRLHELLACLNGDWE